jgi:Flp pilus assembly protein TadD
MLMAAILSLATLILYLPVVGHPFFPMDDQEYVAANPVVSEGLSPAGLRWALTSVGYAANWHPLTWISHMADVSLFGFRPAGHHFTSALLHALSSALLFLALRSMTGASLPAFAAAAIFAWHPQRVESVAWIAERKDVLCGFFVFAALLAYGAYVRRPSGRRYALLCLALASALASKPMAVTLPLALLLLDWWPLGRFRKNAPGRTVLEKVPLLLMAALASWLTWTAQASRGAVTGLAYLAPGERVGAALSSWLRYVRQFAWPAGLGFTYAHPVAGYPWRVTLGAALLLAVATVLALRAWRRGFPPVGWFWFLGTTVPVIGLVQVGAQAAADRYTYLPSVGLAVIVAWLLLPGRLSAGPKGTFRLAAAGLTLAALIPLTSIQLALWKEPRRILERTVAVDPDNLVAHLLLAGARRASGDDQGALEHFGEALRLIPVLGEAHAGIGEILLRRGESARAVEHFRMAAKAAPGDGPARFNLAVALEENRMPLEALREYHSAVELDPSRVAHWGRLAQALDRAGLAGEADATYRAALERFPGSAEMWNNRGIFLAGGGDLEGAEHAFRRALEIDPGSAFAAGNLDALRGRRTTVPEDTGRR